MILLDGDPLIYRIGFAIEHDEMGMTAGRYNMEKTINRILNDLGPHYGYNYRIYIGGEGNFRKKRAQLLPYKGNRAVTGRPKYYDELRAHLTNNWGAKIIDGMEADDKLGIELTKLGDGNAVCVSIDKDLLMVPGHHYNFVKKEFHYITELDGYVNFCKQMLTGDPTDNIPGLRGIGSKTALKLLELNITEPTNIREVQYNLYNKVFDIYKSKVKDGVLKLKNKIDIQVNTDEDIKFVLSELKDLLWIKRYE